MKAIYLVDPVGALVGPVALPVVPGIGCQLPEEAIELRTSLAAPADGCVWALVDGEPRQLADHRGVVYSMEDGGSRTYEALGELPDGLTAQAWPGIFYVWGGDGWVLDAAAQLEAAHAIERTWRNAQISATDYLAMPDYPITAEQRSGLYAYRQALRDWPDVNLFPDQAGRPQPPAWIAEQDQ